MKTRSKGRKSRAAAAKNESTNETKSQALPESDDNPPKLFVLPKGVSSEARIVSLANPATLSPNRYFVCPEKGFYEITRIAAPKNTPTSILITSNTPTEEAQSLSNDGHNDYITRNPDLFVATPIDPMFLVIPVLCPKANAKSSQDEMFLSLDDHFESIEATSRHIKQLVRNAKIRAHLERGMDATCDYVDAGDEKMYRMSMDKVLQRLMNKAKRMSQQGLPASMEERFIQRELEMPILSVRREDVLTSATVESTTETPQPVEQTESEAPSETAGDSQTSLESSITVETTITSVTSQPQESSTEDLAPKISPEVVTLLRIRTAFEFLCKSYLPPHLHEDMRDMIARQEGVNFEPLEKHLAQIKSLKAEAHALRAVSDNVSRKRAYEGDGAAEIRAEKKRKQEEEEKRKKNESHGVKQLKKVDTSGMKKLSSFFAKAPAKKS